MANALPEQPSADAGEITRLLRAAAAGDGAADEALFRAVYHELKTLAAALLRRESRATLEPTALVNEAFLKLGNRGEINWESRRHFYGVAARAMRRVLVDRARGRLREKRSAPTVTLPDQLRANAPLEAVVAVHDALERLAAIDARRAQVVELRWFAGLEVEDVADVLGVSTATVKRDWAAARAWLASELADG